MQISITGGTGFLGSHLARRLAANGHKVRLISRDGGSVGGHRASENMAFIEASVTDSAAITSALDGCDAVAHLAGINIERGSQTYDRVHVDGTENVVTAAEETGVSRLAFSSFLRARPSCGSPYHESKWAAEELVRDSTLDSTVCKAGIIYGQGDQMLTHLSRWLATIPVFASLGRSKRWLRPVAVEDVVDIFAAALVDDRLSGMTVPIVGPETLTLDETVRRVGDVIGRSPVIIPMPVRLHYYFARIQQRFLDTPITSPAQVQMLAEGVTTPAPDGLCDQLPDDLAPSQEFTKARIAGVIGNPQPYGLDDLRL